MTQRILLLPLVLAIPVACGGGDGANRDPILLGVVNPASGDLAPEGRNQQEALALALDEINGAGGVVGRQLELDLRDDGSSAAGAMAAYGQLLADGVPVILGPDHSGGVVAIAAQLRDGKTLTISGSATSPALATLDDGGYFFRTAPSDAMQAVVMAERIRAERRQHLCVVYRDDAYGAAVAAMLRTHLADAALEIVEASYDPATALSQVMDACEPVRAQPEPGVVFITFQADGRLILDDAAARGWTTATQKIFLCGNRNQTVFDALSRAEAFEGAIGTTNTGPDAAGVAGARRAAFRERFLAAHGHASAPYGENHYDATYLAAMAIEIAGAADDRAAMTRTAAGAEGDAGDWAALRAAIAADGEANYRGASGEVDLDASGELRPPYYVGLWTIHDGMIVDTEVVTIEAP